LLPLSTACVSTARIVDTSTGAEVSVGALAEELAGADVVALGELHGTPAVHTTHHALLRALHARRPDMVVAMEMFERAAWSTRRRSARPRGRGAATNATTGR
jgi:uncharacterized iron-regulated protein